MERRPTLLKLEVGCRSYEGQTYSVAAIRTDLEPHVETPVW